MIHSLLRRARERLDYRRRALRAETAVLVLTADVLRFRALYAEERRARIEAGYGEFREDARRRARP